MSTISAGTTTGTALVNTGDTTGNLVLQVNGTTPSLTLNTSGAYGVGATPSYGTSGQILTSAGSAAAPTWTSQSGLSVGIATNIAGGVAGQLSYQSGAGATAFVTNGTSGQLLISNGSSAPSWSSTLTTPTITGTKETKVAIAAANIDLATGNYFTKTISGATTLTVSNVPATGTAISFILDLTNGGSATITWWSGVKWVSGTAPTLTSAGRDVLAFFTHDGGTTWTGLVLGKDVK